MNVPCCMGATREAGPKLTERSPSAVASGVHAPVTQPIRSREILFDMGQSTAILPSSSSEIQGEHFAARERLVIAPQSGIFEPAGAIRTGAPVSAGQVVGHLTNGRERTPVVSPFAGTTGASLALAGERLISHQPVMWLSLGSDAP